MPKRERSHVPIASAAKRARNHIQRSTSKFDLALSGQTSGIDPSEWYDLVNFPTAHMLIPSSLEWLIIDDKTSEAKAFIEYLENNLASGVTGAGHRLTIAREWYCFKAFLFDCLLQIRGEIVALIDLIREPKRDITKLIASVLNVDDHLYDLSVQYIYNAPVGQALAQYCRVNNHELAQPFLHGFVSSSLSDYLWPIFEPLFIWDYVDMYLYPKADRSRGSISQNLNAGQRPGVQSLGLEPQAISTKDLLWHQENISYESACELVQDLILSKTDTASQNLIHLIDIRADRGPVSNVDQPVLHVSHDAIVSFVNPQVALCTASDKSAVTIDMHRVLIDSFRTMSDLMAADQRLPWSRLPKMSIHLAEVCTEPLAVGCRIPGRISERGGFNLINQTQFADCGDDAADLICRVGNIAWNLYRIYALLMKLREKPQEVMSKDKPHAWNMTEP